MGVDSASKSIILISSPCWNGPAAYGVEIHVGSAAGSTVKYNVSESGVSLPSSAVIVAVKEPSAVGVPEIVVHVLVKPSCKPLSTYVFEYPDVA